MPIFVGFDGLPDGDYPESESVPKDTPAWKVFEQDVTEVLKQFDDGQVSHNVKVPGELSKVQRQIDVQCVGSLFGIEMTVAVECKYYKKPIDVKVVDSFVGMLLDVGATSGILYSFSGATPGATQRAANARTPKIALRDIQHLMPWSENLTEIIEEELCQETGCWGTIDWRDMDADNESGNPKADGPVPFSTCEFCGSHTIRCPSCDYELWDWDGDAATCEDCELKIQVWEDLHHGNYETVTVTSTKVVDAEDEI